MQHRQNVAQKPNGDIVAGASVTVTTYPGGVAAVLYSDNGITPIPGGNVVSTDSNGNYSYYVANGRYTETISGSGLTTQTLQDIVLADPAAPTITGGSIDGTTIGATTPSTGGFTTVTGTSVLRGTSQLPYVLAQTAIPIILVPNGTVATNGTITLGTALPTIYANAWIRLPAGAVSGGAAGVYFCQFSSNTVGQVYTNFADPSTTAFTPSIPTSPVAATGSNAAYTQTTGSFIDLARVSVPANSLGANGKLVPAFMFQFSNNVNNKAVQTLYDGQFAWGTNYTTSTGVDWRVNIRNRGITNKQICGFSFGNYQTSNAFANTSYLTVDSTLAKDNTYQGQLATATDYIVLEGFTIEVLHKP